MGISVDMRVQSLQCDVRLYHFPQGIHWGLPDLVNLVASLFWESFPKFWDYRWANTPTLLFCVGTRDPDSNPHGMGQAVSPDPYVNICTV